METVIRNVLIYDGSGKPPFCGDVVLTNDTISAVIPTEKSKSCGLSLAPGFIDVHAHSDLTLLAAPDAFSKISQGVTSEISGNCGQSFFPVTEKNRSHLERLCKNYNVPLQWDSFLSYLNVLKLVAPAVNYNFLCGQGTLRAAVMGYEPDQATPLQINKMYRLLQQIMEQGACGLSTGLLYVPGRFSDQEELTAVMAALKDRAGVYATHLRSEGDKLEEAVEEALTLAQAGSGILQLSHLKTAQKRNWHKLDAVLMKIDHARRNGLQVYADRYPYTFSQTSLSIILPGEYADMTDAAIQERLSRDPAECQRLIDWFRMEVDRDWNQIILSFSSLAEFQPCLGMTFTQIADHFHHTPQECVMDVLRKDAARAQGAFGSLSPDNMLKILQQDYVCCGSDENARPLSESLGRSHPRGFGSFPRFINTLRASGVPMEETIRRVTSLPAQIFGLKKRGLIRPGYYADLVLFDDAALRDTADFTHPHSAAEGIVNVYVNGVKSFADGKVIARAGRFLDRT